MQLLQFPARTRPTPDDLPEHPVHFNRGIQPFPVNILDGILMLPVDFPGKYPGIPIAQNAPPYCAGILLQEHPRRLADGIGKVLNGFLNHSANHFVANRLPMPPFRSVLGQGSPWRQENVVPVVVAVTNFQRPPVAGQLPAVFPSPYLVLNGAEPLIPLIANKDVQETPFTVHPVTPFPSHLHRRQVSPGQFQSRSRRKETFQKSVAQLMISPRVQQPSQHPGMFFLLPDYVQQAEQVKLRQLPPQFRQVRVLAQLFQRCVLFRRIHSRTVPQSAKYRSGRPRRAEPLRRRL